jgi:hypothetical protein
MKTIITADELIRRVNGSLTPEVAEVVKSSYRAARSAMLVERQVAEPMSVERLRICSTTVDFEVDPNLQNYK